MRLSWDEGKRQRTLAERGLDFADAAEVFAGVTHTFEDTRRLYPESRFVTVGHLKGRLVVLVYTPRGRGRHLISMRKANAREQKLYQGTTG
ncbi:MAG: BrnT family toxin [Candidatus Methylomirabilota bacterium]